MHAVYIEQIFRIGEINFRSNMRILQGNLPKHIQIFADINLIGSSPLRLTVFTILICVVEILIFIEISVVHIKPPSVFFI